MGIGEGEGRGGDRVETHEKVSALVMIGWRAAIFVSSFPLSLPVCSLSVACSRIKASVTSSSSTGKGISAFPLTAWRQRKRQAKHSKFTQVNKSQQS